MDPDPNNVWYVQKQGGRVEGPLLDQQVLKLAKEGKIAAWFKLRHAQRTAGKWVVATEVPGVGKLVMQNASGTGEMPPDFEVEPLADGLPTWATASQSPPTAVPGATDYWSHVTHGLAADSAKQAASKQVPQESKSSDSSSRNTASDRKFNDILIGGAILLMLVGILISGGMFMAGGLFLGEERQLTERGKANRRELKNGIDRAAQAVKTSSSRSKVKRVSVGIGTVIITDNGYSEVNQVRIECNNGNVLSSQWRRNAANKFGYDLEEPTVTETTNRMTVILAIRNTIANYLNGKYD